jgi:DNA-binding NtrC family response regulator
MATAKILRAPAVVPRPSPTPSPSPTPPPSLDALLRAAPDLVDRIFDYVVELMPEIALRREEIIKQLRDEFAGERVYIRRRADSEADEVALKVLNLFNGRNASEVARTLRIGRATVYRKLKQPGPR